LTFPATSLSLVAVTEKHGLVRVDSVTAPGGEQRQLWMTPEAFQLLSGEADAYFPVEAFALVTDRYVLGQLVRVSRLGDPAEQHPDFEMLHTHDEIWVLCCRRPKASQYRFFGRFTAQGEFVVLFGRSRKSLANDGYDLAVQEFILRWLNMFGNHDCHRAETCEAYIGGVVIDVDEEK
jgi:hypothetical protein